MTKPPLDELKALDEIDDLMSSIDGILPYKMTPIYKLVGGKLYELYVLCRTVSELAHRGWHVYFNGTMVRLKSSPGEITKNEPHFELRLSPAGPVKYRLYTDIQVLTLGRSLGSVSDLSAYHEIDIVVVPDGTHGKPSHKALALGIECKATADFSKSHVREVLGRRRELSLYSNRPRSTPLALSSGVTVKANPPSEYWLRYIDKKGDNYRDSPAEFGIDLSHWPP